MSQQNGQNNNSRRLSQPNNSNSNATPNSAAAASRTPPQNRRGGNRRTYVSPRTRRSRQVTNDLWNLIDLPQFQPTWQESSLPEQEDNESDLAYTSRLHRNVVEEMENDPSIDRDQIQTLRTGMQSVENQLRARTNKNEPVPAPGPFHHEEQNLFYGVDQGIPQTLLPQHSIIPEAPEFESQNNLFNYFPGGGGGGDNGPPFLGGVDMVDDANALAAQQYYFQNPVQQNVPQGGRQQPPLFPVTDAPFLPNSTFDFDMNYGQDPTLPSVQQFGQGPTQPQNFSAGAFIPPSYLQPQPAYQEPPNVFDDLPGPAYGYTAIPDLPSPGFSHGFIDDGGINLDDQDNINNDDLNQFFQSPTPAPAPAQFPPLAPAPAAARILAPAPVPTPAPAPIPAQTLIIFQAPNNNNAFVPNSNAPSYDWLSRSPNVAVWPRCTYSESEIQRARNLGTFPFIYPPSLDLGDPNTWPNIIVRCGECHRAHKPCTIRTTGRPCERCDKFDLGCDISRYYHVNYTGVSTNRTRPRKRRDDDDDDNGNGGAGPATKRQRTQGGNTKSSGGNGAAAGGTSSSGRTVTTGGQKFSTQGPRLNTRSEGITPPTQTYTVTQKPLARAPNKQEAANPQPNVRHAGLGFYVDDGPAHRNETAAEARERQQLARENMNIELKTVRTRGMSDTAYARAETDRRQRNSQRREAARRFVIEFCDQNGYDRPAENPYGYDSENNGEEDVDMDAPLSLRGGHLENLDEYENDEDDDQSYEYEEDEQEDDDEDDGQDENEVHLRGGGTMVIDGSGDLGDRGGGGGTGGGSGGARKANNSDEKPQPCIRCAQAPFKAPGRCSLVLNPGSQPPCVKCTVNGVPNQCVRREAPAGPRGTKRKTSETQEAPRKKPAIPPIPTFSSLPADTRSTYGDRTAAPAPAPRPAAARPTAADRARRIRPALIGNIPCSHRCGRNFAPDDDDSRLDHEMQCDRAPRTQESEDTDMLDYDGSSAGERGATRGSWNYVEIGSAPQTAEDQFNALSQEAAIAPRSAPAESRTRAGAKKVAKEAAKTAATKPKLGVEPPLALPPAAGSDRCWECQRLNRACGGRFTGSATWPICRPCFDAGRADFCMWGEQLEAAVDPFTRAQYVRADIVDPANETLVSFNYRQKYAKMYAVRSADLPDLRQNEFITLDTPPYSAPIPDTRLLVGVNPVDTKDNPITRPSPDNPPAIGPLSGIPVPVQIAQINNGADFLNLCKELTIGRPTDPDRIHTEHEYVYHSCRPQRMNRCGANPAKTCDTTPHRRFSPDFHSCGGCNSEQHSYQLEPQRDVVNKTKHFVCSTHAKEALDQLISPGDLGDQARRVVKWNHCTCTQQTLFSWLCNMDRDAAMNEVRSRTLLFNEYLIKKGWNTGICGAGINRLGTPQNDPSCLQLGAPFHDYNLSMWYCRSCRDLVVDADSFRSWLFVNDDGYFVDLWKAAGRSQEEADNCSAAFYRELEPHIDQNPLADRSQS